MKTSTAVWKTSCKVFQDLKIPFRHKPWTHPPVAESVRKTGPETSLCLRLASLGLEVEGDENGERHHLKLKI